MALVNITIHSVIENIDGTGDVERAHAEARGEYSFLPDGGRLEWCEKSEGGEISSRLFVSSDTVKAERCGAIESSLVFIEGERTESVYKMGPYAFDSSVTARRVKTALSDSGISVTVVYEMDLGGAVRLVKMKIRAEVISEVSDA